MLTCFGVELAESLRLLGFLDRRRRFPTLVVPDRTKIQHHKERSAPAFCSPLPIASPLLSSSTLYSISSQPKLPNDAQLALTWPSASRSTPTSCSPTSPSSQPSPPPTDLLLFLSSNERWQRRGGFPTWFERSLDRRGSGDDGRGLGSRIGLGGGTKQTENTKSEGVKQTKGRRSGEKVQGNQKGKKRGRKETKAHLRPC